VDDYRAQRDARDEARENGEWMRMEDDEFAAAWPVVTFKDWLLGTRR